MRRVIVRGMLMLLMAALVFSGDVARAKGGPGKAPAHHPSAPKMPRPHVSAAPHFNAPQPPRVVTPPKVHTNNPTANSHVGHAPKTSRNLNSTSMNALTSGAFSGATALGAGLNYRPSMSTYGYQPGYRSGSRRGYARSPRYRGNSSLQRQQMARMLKLRKLIADLNSLSPGLVTNANHRNVIRGDLSRLIRGGNRANSTGVQKIATGLVDALPARRNQALNTARLAGDLESVVNGSRLPAGRFLNAVRDAEGLLRASGAPPAKLQTLDTAMRSMTGAVRIR